LRPRTGRRWQSKYVARTRPWPVVDLFAPSLRPAVGNESLIYQADGHDFFDRQDIVGLLATILSAMDPPDGQPCASRWSPPFRSFQRVEQLRNGCDSWTFNHTRTLPRQTVGVRPGRNHCCPRWPSPNSWVPRSALPSMATTSPAASRGPAIGNPGATNPFYSSSGIQGREDRFESIDGEGMPPGKREKTL